MKIFKEITITVYLENVERSSYLFLYSSDQTFLELLVWKIKLQAISFFALFLTYMFLLNLEHVK